LCSNPSLTTPDISFAGRHLSAAEFHSVLQSVGTGSDTEAPAGQNDVVVLDARNLYETRIGKFHVPNVETLHPEIRQYSDLPLWIDEHTEKLRGTAQEVYGVRWPQLISAPKVKALRMFFNYTVAFRDIWSNIQMVAILMERILYLTIESLWEAIKITYLELVWYVDLPMMTIPLGVVAAIAECWS
uniref:Rhodanese domain-containing protein n=1 Tax=Aegilops tauschii subsp. strangulata TaxID=200361 RepID=A0A453JYV8_AEGTS